MEDEVYLLDGLDDCFLGVTPDGSPVYDSALAEAMERRPEEALVLALIWMTDKHRRSEKVAQGVAQLLRQLQEKLDAGSPVS